MRSLFLAAAAAFAATLPATGALAQEEIVPNPTGSVSNLALETVGPVLRDAGLNITANFSGKAELMLAEMGGRNVILAEEACTAPTKCAGLMIIALINDQAGADVVNEFNSRQKPARATSMQEGVMLDHYLMADYGTTRGTLVVNIGVMMAMIDGWFQYRQNGGAMSNTISSTTLAPGAQAAHSMRSAAIIGSLRDAMAAGAANGPKIGNE
jgi:hypothetical protein